MSETISEESKEAHGDELVRLLCQSSIDLRKVLDLINGEQVRSVYDGKDGEPVFAVFATTSPDLIKRYAAVADEWDAGRDQDEFTLSFQTKKAAAK